MLEIRSLDHNKTIINATVQGQISLGDIDYARETLAHDYAQITGLRLLLDLRGFKGWDSSRSFFEHIGLVLKQTSNLARVALVSDKFYIKDIGHIIEMFNHFDIKHFNAERFDDANNWIREENLCSIELLKLNTNEDTIYELTFRGFVKRVDYLSVIGPQLNDYLSSNDRLCLLVNLTEYDSFELSIIFDDLKMWIKNRKTYIRMAIIGQAERFASLLNLLSKLEHFDYTFFNEENKEEALIWLGKSE
jgi:hypothetical protein